MKRFLVAVLTAVLFFPSCTKSLDDASFYLNKDGIPCVDGYPDVSESRFKEHSGTFWTVTEVYKVDQNGHMSDDNENRLYGLSSFLALSWVSDKMTLYFRVDYNPFGQYYYTGQYGFKGGVVTCEDLYQTPVRVLDVGSDGLVLLVRTRQWRDSELTIYKLKADDFSSFMKKYPYMSNYADSENVYLPIISH